MSFWQSLRLRLQSMMQGRNGVDALSNFTLLLGLGLLMLDLLLGSGVMRFVGLALYVITLYRMFSRNKPKRMQENSRYLAISGVVRAKVQQFIQRRKNSKQYKYFRCPQCGTLLRLTRGCGPVQVTCAKCKHEFSQRA